MTRADPGDGCSATGLSCKFGLDCRETGATGGTTGVCTVRDPQKCK